MTLVHLHHTPCLFEMPPAATTDRPALRQRLLSERRQFAAGPGYEAATQALQSHVAQVLNHLGPDCLGIYWPLRAEFNAATCLLADEKTAHIPLALPFAHKAPPQMHYRRWDGQPPTLRDACDIPTASGEEVVPDVVLVPCVGYTDTGYRLGYGGGYFDRYLDQHPHVTAVGVAWALNRMSAEEFVPQAHDRALMFVITEHGVVG